MNRKTFPKSLQRARGVTLIELMIALVLGLLVVAAAIGIFLSNKQVFQTTDNLSRMQDHARIGFELMARELRMAGARDCSREIPLVNVLNPTSAFGTDWSTGVRDQNGDL